MNFSLCANMSGFAQTVTYKHIKMHIDPTSLNQIHCIIVCVGTESLFVYIQNHTHAESTTEPFDKW